MEITGKIRMIYETKQISDKFRKREFVITVPDEKYTQHLLFELVQSNCDILDSYLLGAEVKVLFNIRGREWVAKDGHVRYFNSMQAWKVEEISKKTGEVNNNNNNNNKEINEQFRVEATPDSKLADDDSGLPF